MSPKASAAPRKPPCAGDRIGLNLARSATGAANLNAIFIETGDRSNLTLVARPDEAPSTTLGDKPSADSTRRTVCGTSGADFTTTLADIGVPIPVIDDITEVLAFNPDIPANPGPGARFRIVYEAPHGADPRLDRLTLTDTAGREHLLLQYTARRESFALAKPADTRQARREAVTLTEPMDRPDPRPPKGEPVPGGRLTSPWGWRVHPVLGRPQFHKGVDHSAPAGTPVLATAYAHLKDFVHGLKPGAHVRQGQVIGYVGRSGLATGNHLYYEVYDNGQKIDPLGGAASTAQHLSDAELKRLRRALARNGTTID